MTIIYFLWQVFKGERWVRLSGESSKSSGDFGSAEHKFAFRAQDVSQEDLRIIADIDNMAINSRFMAKVLEESNVG